MALGTRAAKTKDPNAGVSLTFRTARHLPTFAPVASVSTLITYAMEMRIAPEVTMSMKAVCQPFSRTPVLAVR